MHLRTCVEKLDKKPSTTKKEERETKKTRIEETRENFWKQKTKREKMQKAPGHIEHSRKKKQMKKVEEIFIFSSLYPVYLVSFPSLPYPEDQIKTDISQQKNTESQSLLLSHALSLHVLSSPPSPLTAPAPCALVRPRSSVPPLPAHGGSMPCSAHLLPPARWPEPAAPAEVQAAAIPLLAQVDTSSPHLQCEASEGTVERCAHGRVVAEPDLGQDALGTHLGVPRARHGCIKHSVRG